MSKLIIQTLTWNKLPLLEALNKSLRPALEGIDYVWHIKSNGCADGTVEAASKWENTVLHAYPDNKQSFAEGMNYIFEQAKPEDDDLILLLNNDVEFRDTESIHNMIKCVNDDTGVVGCRMLYTGTDKLQHAGVVFHEGNSLPIHLRAGEVSSERDEKNRYFQAVTGAVLLTKAKLYRDVCQNPSGRSGMDEQYRWMYEDIDLCLAIRGMGKNIVYCGQTNIFHGESVSLKENPVNRMYLKENIQHFRDRWQDNYANDRISYLVNPDFYVIPDDKS